MVFSTIEFLFQFLPIFLLAYYATPQKYRNITLIIGSLVFYAIGSGWYTLLLLLSLVINYGLSRLISGSHARHPQQAKRYLIGGLVYNFGLLVVFKYTNFLIGNLNSLLSIFHVAIPKASIIMPLGISFFTFQITSYLIDVYQNKTRPARSLLDLGVYLCMFPQLISGPICMYSEIQPQMHNRRVDIRLLEEGMETFVLGLSAKTLLANPMGGLWNNLSVIGYDSISTPYAWLGAFAYSFQIYFDFSGYSMMAIGVGKMLGFELPQNFNLPYMSGSAGEFWRRWHITLGRWFKNYIYFRWAAAGWENGKTMRNMLAVWGIHRTVARRKLELHHLGHLLRAVPHAGNGHRQKGHEKDPSYSLFSSTFSLISSRALMQSSTPLISVSSISPLPIWKTGSMVLAMPRSAARCLLVKDIVRSLLFSQNQIVLFSFSLRLIRPKMRRARLPAFPWRGRGG